MKSKNCYTSLKITFKVKNCNWLYHCGRKST